MRTNVCGVWPNQSVAIKLLNAMASPTRDTAHGKHACKQIQVNADGVICGGNEKGYTDYPALS